MHADIATAFQAVVAPPRRTVFMLDRALPAIDMACQHYGVSRAEFWGQGRAKPAMSARKAAVLAIRNATTWANNQAAVCLKIPPGKQMKRLRSARTDYARDPEFAALVDRMTAVI